MDELRKIFNLIDSYSDDVIELQSELTSRIALGPENGGSGEHEKTEFIKDLLNGYSPDLLDEVKAPDKRAKGGYRPNIVAVWGDIGAERTVWVLSHTDIVPPGDLSLWESDPYQVKVEGDRIIGRGVEDNQHGFVSSYLGLKAILDSGIKPMLPVGLAVVADEETGSDYGLDYILKTRGGYFKKSDLIIVPDGGNENGTMIEVAEKSMLWLKFTVIGKQCHASTPGSGLNSLYGAARLIVDLRDLKEQFNITDDLFKPPFSTFEPTKIEANVPNVNTIPGKDVFYMDCRILPLYSVDEIVKQVKVKAHETAKKLDLDIKVEDIYRQDATEPTSKDAPVVAALADAIMKVTGEKARPMGIGGGTVAAFFRRAGLPAAVWCTSPDTPHQPNEYCLISDILSDAKVFACLYMNSFLRNS